MEQAQVPAEVPAEIRPTLTIQEIIQPTAIDSLYDNFQPVQVIILTRLEAGGLGPEYRRLDIQAYPFDTVDDLKGRIFLAMGGAVRYLPRFLFLGNPRAETDVPRQQESYTALDYLWYLPGSTSEAQSLNLQSPLASLSSIQRSFRTADGGFPGVSLTQRGRSLIEDIFPRIFNQPGNSPRNLPVLHAFPLEALVRGFGRPLGELSEADWNGRFRPFFPGITTASQASPTERDERLAGVLRTFLERKDRALGIIGELLELHRPKVSVEGVKQLRLTWPKKIPRFEGVEHLFYRLRVTNRRSFMRLLPSQGTAVTKLHVTGGVPIPTISDPKLLPQWGKEVSPTADKDFLMLKYLHRDALGSLPAIYGTIRVFEEGSADLLLQPPKKIRKLELEYDFAKFDQILAESLADFPGEIRASNFNLAEISLLFSVAVDSSVGRFTRAKFVKRLGVLQPFFQEIEALPDQQPVISLRYKAVSQFVTEDKIGTFLIQYATRLILQGEGLTTELIRATQAEFALSDEEARAAVARWFENRGAFTVAVPEDGDFIEAYNPGVDLYIFGQHPYYSIHCHRIDSFHTFQRIYSLLGVLFFEDDDYFNVGPRIAQAQAQAEVLLERDDLHRERTAAGFPEPAAPPAAAPAAAPPADVPVAIPMPEVVEEGVGGEADEIPDFFMAEVFGDEDIPVAQSADADDVPAASSAANEVLDGPGSVAPDESFGPAAGAAAAAAVAAASPPRPATTRYSPEAPAESDRPLPAPSLVPAVQIPIQSSRVPVAASAASAAAAPAPVAANDRDQTINPSSWFLKKLKEVDRRLFEYSPKAGELGYARMCAANDDRMPNILTKEQYKRMRSVYEYDEDIEFIELPLTGDEEPKKKPGYEQYFILRFGSNPANPNYFICPELFCLLDEILIRPRDFASIRDRDGRPKPANTCPFCRGKLITSKQPVPGATIYKRKNKPKADTFHSYINFLKKTSHPEGFMLPCCFIEPKLDREQTYRKLLRADDPAFVHFKSGPSIEHRIELPLPAAAALAAPAERAEILGDADADNDTDAEAASEMDAESEGPVARGAVEYGVILQKIHKEYILGPEKHPLDPGKIAVLPPSFERFFNQKSAALVKRAHIRQELAADSRGFLRMGVENSPGQKESLFAVLAPLLGRNSIQEVRERILEVCQPMVFISANFGNLVNEFYNPSDPEPDELELKRFVNRLVDTDISPQNRQSLRRVFNSYHRFLDYVKDASRTKQLRHFQSLLAEPGLFFPRGLQLVVLDWTQESGARISEQGLPTVRCPSYGVSVDRHKMNDIAFVGRDNDGLFELFFYTDNKPALGGFSGTHINTERFKMNEVRSWPSIVRQRVSEYFNQCQSLYRSLYTPQEGLPKDIRSLVPLSLIETLIQGRNFYGVIRDNYNHAVGVSYKFNRNPGSRRGGVPERKRSDEDRGRDVDEEDEEDFELVIVPVVDDGAILGQRHIHFGFDDCRPLASLPHLLRTYVTSIQPQLSLFPGYRVRFILRQKDDGYMMIQLANGIMIPCYPMSKREFDELNLAERYRLDVREYSSVEGMTIESYVNKFLSDAKCGENPELKKRLSSQQLDELYQHFRLTFANWLNSAQAGPEVRKKVEAVIFSSLPEYEKRKRLEIMLAGSMATWLQSDDEAWEGPEGFLRKDCRLLDSEERCTGVCRWRESGEPRCRLHIPTKSPLGSSAEVSTSELFIKRVLDELVRFPHRRRQLIKGKVGVLTEILEPVRFGDQFIIPENSLTWSELLRLDWARFEPEKPEFYEEMSRTMTGEETSEEAGAEAASDEVAMPAELAEYLGEQPSPIKFLASPDERKTLVPFLRLIGVKLFRAPEYPPTTRIDDEFMRRFVSEAKKTIGVIDFSQAAAVASAAFAAATPEPRVKFLRNIADRFSNIHIFVVLSSGKIGMLVKNETQPYLEAADLPERIRPYYDEAPGIIPGMRARAAAPAPPTVGGTRLRISRSSRYTRI
jgi:hypothetical protein